MAFIEVVTGDPELQPTMAPLQERIDRILGDLRGGDAAGGARRFVEDVAFGPGGWEQLPEPVCQAFVGMP